MVHKSTSVETLKKESDVGMLLTGIHKLHVGMLLTGLP